MYWIRLPEIHNLEMASTGHNTRSEEKFFSLFYCLLFLVSLPFFPLHLIFSLLIKRQFVESLASENMYKSTY